MRALIDMYQRIGLVPLIIIGLILGVLIGWLMPSVGIALGLLGSLFVGALKAVAPILVFILVMAAIIVKERIKWYTKTYGIFKRLPTNDS